MTFLESQIPHTLITLAFWGCVALELAAVIGVALVNAVLKRMEVEL